MYMAIDESGQDGRIRQVDDLRTSGIFEAVLNGYNLVTLHMDRNVLSWRIGNTIDKSARVNDQIGSTDRCSGQNENQRQCNILEAILFHIDRFPSVKCNRPGPFGAHPNSLDEIYRPSTTIER